MQGFGYDPNYIKMFKLAQLIIEYLLVRNKELLTTDLAWLLRDFFDGIMSCTVLQHFVLLDWYNV